MVTVNPAENSGKDDLMESLQTGKLTRGELQRSAINICRFLLNTPAFERFTGNISDLDKELDKCTSDLELSVKNCSTINMTENEILFDVDKINTLKGKTTVMNVFIPLKGKYQLNLTLRATGGGDLAQIPLTIHKDNQIIKAITLNGSQTDWITEEIPLDLCISEKFFLRFYFAQSGIEIKEAKLFVTEDWEERIRLFLEANKK